jgi:hypothetical protein
MIQEMSQLTEKAGTHGEAAIPEPVWLSYHVGGKDVHGQVITSLPYRSQEVCVYIVEGERIGWHFSGNEGADSDRSVAEVNVLSTELKIMFPKGSILKRGIYLIAADFAEALTMRRSADERDLFAPAREFIGARRRESLHIAYLVSAFFTMIALGVFGLSLSTSAEYRQFLVAASFGSLGSFVSIAQRLKNTPIERFSSRRYTAIAGVSRSLLGSIFGMLFLLFQKAGLVLSFAGTNTFILYAVAVAAGFSERLVPQLLERFESQAVAEKRSE